MVNDALLLVCLSQVDDFSKHFSGGLLLAVCLLLFCAAELVCGMTPGAVMAGFHAERLGFSGELFGKRLLLLLLKGWLLGLSLAVGWGVVYFIATQISLNFMPFLLGFLCVLGLIGFGFYGLDKLEYRLDVEVEWWPYAQPAGLILSALPVCLGLFYLSWPQFPGPEVPAKISGVKRNMHALQTMLETYAQKGDGRYPESLEVLYRHAQAQGFWQNDWQDLTHPYTEKRGKAVTLVDGLAQCEPPQLKCKGRVSLNVPVSEKYLRYYIYGFDFQGRMIQERGQIFVLSNS